MQKYIIKKKILFLGYENSGKTSILKRWYINEFNQTEQPTVGMDFASVLTNVENLLFRIQLWDCRVTSKSFRSLIPYYLKDTDVVIICYDSSDIKYFAVEYWLDLVKSEKEDASIFIFGNKIDKEPREVPADYVINLANVIYYYTNQNYQAYFYEISAKTNYNIEESFTQVIQILSDQIYLKIYPKINQLQNILTFELKIIIIGDKQVGKTSIINQLLFNQMIIQEDIQQGQTMNKFKHKTFDIDNQVKLEIQAIEYDSRFVKQNSNQFLINNTDIILLCYSLCDFSTQQNIVELEKLIIDNKTKAKIVIIGNKIDQNNSSLAKQIRKKMLDELNENHIVISAKQKSDISFLFKCILTECKKKMDSVKSQIETKILSVDEKKVKWCITF